MAEHKLKCEARWFQALADGSKNFEIRADDRPGGFQVGDVLHLEEIEIVPFAPRGEANHARFRSRTGRVLSRRVTYVLELDDVIDELYGVGKRWVAMGLEVCDG